MRTRIRLARSWVRWVMNGRPRTHPVICRVGRLIVNSNGTRSMDGWGFSTLHMNTWIDIEDLYEHLALTYPHTIEWESVRG